MSNSYEDSNLILNLQSHVEERQPPKKKKELKNSENNQKTEANRSSKLPREIAVTHNNKSAGQKRKYIDPKDFVPISTLFEKNPEIPKIISEDHAASRTQEISFSPKALEHLPINNRLKGNLREQFQYDSLTQVQCQAIPTLLRGNDAMIKSPTGSGKTMCYAIPIVDKLSLMKEPVQRSHGPYAVVLLPTRELALQTYNVFQELCKSAINIVPGIIVGGEKCKAEKSRLRKGVNILVATPGRLNYHLKETACLNTSNLCFLVLDEVDRLLDMGFKASVIDIIEQLDKRGTNERQTVLMSATLNTQINELASVSTKNPVVVDGTKAKMDNTDTEQQSNVEYVLPSSLQQYYAFVPAKLRLVTLFLFLISKNFASKRSGNSKVIVFMPNKSSVTFNYQVFSLVLTKLYEFGEKSSNSVFQLHGDMEQSERFEMFKKFKSALHGVLFCTDVAARGLDINKVNWIVQYSCPLQIEDYLHKVGRTARIGMQGNSLLFLLPSEANYVPLLAARSIVLEEIKVDDLLSNSIKLLVKSKQRQQQEREKATELQKFVEETVEREKSYRDMAMLAYASFIQSYSSYSSSQKDIFHVKKLHLGHIAKSFGLREAPGKLKGKVPQKDVMSKTSHKEPPTKKRKQAIPKDGIFSGPRPGKSNNKKKKKLRV